MTDAVRRRRKKAKRSSDQSLWFVAAAVGLVILGGVGWVVYSKVMKPKIVGLPEIVELPTGEFNLTHFVEEAYGSANREFLVDGKGVDVPWEKTERGKRFVTPDGHSFEMELSRDQAVVTHKGTFEGTPRAVMNEPRFHDFMIQTRPSPAHSNRLNENGRDDLTKLRDAIRKLCEEFDQSWKLPKPMLTTTVSGKLIEATAKFEYDQAAKLASFRLELKRID